MSISKEAKSIVIPLAPEMNARIEDAKTLIPRGNRMSSKRQAVLRALDAGLPDGRGRVATVRDIQEPNFIELPDYLKEAVDIDFVGEDVDFLIDRYGLFLLEKLEDGGRLDLTVGRSCLSSRIVKEFIGRLQDSKKFKDRVMLSVVESVPMNIVWDMRSIVSWTNFENVRGPFLYVPDSVISPGYRLLEYRHNVCFGRQIVNGSFSESGKVHIRQN